ncbi:PH domain-containing protein [Shewanella ulleungensis]|uniref:Membrane protein n=1 Tax=Shewanella ulleungensis TaxID=2282699 RepID=A0ABQ2QM05_9GAMM|nr:PH domain-containing protein [Shewanella ulleungensis]MCL1150092.1 PH domain-containing protein [Shewanella ulleungensis]GGP86595.1 membrane protein [Shewanella ulleungensis]
MRDQKRVSAHFHANLGLYWLLSGAVFFLFSVVGIPLLLLWFPLGLLAIKRYIANMSAELTEQKLIVRKGLLTRTENTVPLDKITDMALIQGPIMRMFGLHKLTVETAGQSGIGSLINLVGIVDVQEFREKVLLQQSLLRERQTAATDVKNTDTLLVENLQQINATLLRIEQNLPPHSSQ